MSKTNFLEVYGRAHVRVMTPENIRTAWRKTGIWPFNPDIVTPEVMAPSRESSWQVHMPLPQPTPVRVMANLIRVRIEPQIDEEGEDDESETHRLQDQTQHKDDVPQTPRAARAPEALATSARSRGFLTNIDPVLVTTAATAQPRTAAPAPASSPSEATPTPIVHAPSAHPTPRTSLLPTSAGFLVRQEPITSDMVLPRAHVSLPDKWSVPPELLAADPRTELEAQLQAMLRTALQVNGAQHDVLRMLHASMVLQNGYCERLRGQLVVEERKKKKKDGGRLLGDGLPHLLSGKDFFGRVEEHEEVAVRAEREQLQRSTEHAVYLAAMEEWKKGEEERKRENEARTAAWKSKVSEWEIARDTARQEGGRFGIKKPVRGPLLKAAPKPRACAQPESQEEPTEDFTAALEGDVGSESDDD